MLVSFHPVIISNRAVRASSCEHPFGLGTYCRTGGPRILRRPVITVPYSGWCQARMHMCRPEKTEQRVEIRHRIQAKESNGQHVILPKVAQGRNFNSLCHVRRVGLYNLRVSEEIVTTSGLRIRINEKSLARLQQKYNGKALKIVLKDQRQWCDVALKFVCCDFVAPNNVNMECSRVKAPANQDRGEDKKAFTGPNQTIPAPEKLEPITLQIENEALFFFFTPLPF
ncbi:hypothetical protein FI667_g8121, partial [Globisporangium splendens]